MAHLPVHGIPMVEEADASREIAKIYAVIKHDLQTPFVPNWAKATAPSPAALKMYVGMVSAFYKHLSLPRSLVAMIFFAVAQEVNCVYCSATNELACRTLGVDEQTLSAITAEMTAVKPDRTRGIVQFALKVATNPQGLRAEDYDEVRAYGITNEEIIEIVMIAGMALFNDVLADSLKIEVDPEVADALGK
jgi:uncharacterized peroxidase-related enzyme